MPRTVMGRWFDRVFRNPRTGDVVVAQWPNLPLWIYLAATAIRLVIEPSGGGATAVSVLAGAALGWWAVAEIGWGDSLFRRALGVAVLVGLVANVAAG